MLRRWITNQTCFDRSTTWTEKRPTVHPIVDRQKTAYRSMESVETVCSKEMEIRGMAAVHVAQHEQRFELVVVTR